MRPLLRIVAVLLALGVFLALLQTIDILLRGGISALIRSGALGAATVLGWLLILVAGPFASIHLWRLRRSGLYATAMLSGFLFAYYFGGLLFLRAHNAPLMPILAYVVFNGVLVVLLASHIARRSCT
jgi:CHASE2 domain-containing sensor protein